MDFRRIIRMLEPDWTGLTEHLRSALDTDVEILREVNASVLSHEGKMIRPMIALLIARACGGVNENVINLAAASEMIHNATLMHDDVADGSKQRRGKPTIMSVFGSSTAVLVGDFWLSRAVNMISGTSSESRLIKQFSKTISDLAEGEMIQMKKALSADTEEEDYFRIIRCKTASLFEAAAVSAAISAGATTSEEEAAQKFARAFGIAFQIKDDILDYTGDSSLGKPVGIDIREQKITLPLLGALKGFEESGKIRKMISEIHEKPENAEFIRGFVLESGGVEYAENRLKDYIGEAIAALDTLPDCREKAALVELAGFNALRTR